MTSIAPGANKSGSGGSAYELGPASHNPLFTEVAKGSPCGELLRRYWHPVGTSADATATPRKVRALGEASVIAE